MPRKHVVKVRIGQVELVGGKDGLYNIHLLTPSGEPQRRLYGFYFGDALSRLVGLLVGNGPQVRSVEALAQRVAQLEKDLSSYSRRCPSCGRYFSPRVRSPLCGRCSGE